MASDLPDTSQTRLYTFNKDDDQLKFGAPRLLPKGTIVDVVSKFPWTTLPEENRSHVPAIELVEYRITSSTLIQSFLQQARSAVDSAGNTFTHLVDAVKQGANIAGFNISDEDMSKWLKATDFTSNVSWLEPYRHLYPVEPTKWRYRFPFLTNQNQKVATDWSEKNTSDIVGGSKEATKKSFFDGAIGNVLNSLEVAARASKMSNILQPGSFTETIKHFNPSEGEAYKVEFTLYNTLDFKDIQSNWELCFILSYQNKPNRRSVSLLDPSVIYSVSIPGVNQFLYAFISDLEITNEGTSRYVDLGPGIGTKLIPEAYRVSFTIKSLLTPTQNLYLYAHTGNKVEVSVT